MAQPVQQVTLDVGHRDYLIKKKSKPNIYFIMVLCMDKVLRHL